MNRVFESISHGTSFSNSKTFSVNDSMKTLTEYFVEFQLEVT